MEPSSSLGVYGQMSSMSLVQNGTYKYSEKSGPLLNKLYWSNRENSFFSVLVFDVRLGWFWGGESTRLSVEVEVHA